MKTSSALAACAAVLAALLVPTGALAARAHGMNGKERRLVRQINVMRFESGLGRLQPSRRLARAADVHSADMSRRGFFAHDSSNGTDSGARISRFVHTGMIGETLAYVPVGGGGSARHVFDLWMASPPHLATLTTGGFGRIGIARRHGRLQGQRVVFWTADFAARR